MTYFTAPGILVNGSIFIDYAKLIQLTSHFFDVSEDDLVSKKRQRHIVEPRQFLMHYLKTVKRQLLRNIGYNIGERDHTTVIHAVTTIDNLCKTNKDYLATRIEFQTFITLNS